MNNVYFVTFVRDTQGWRRYSVNNGITMYAENAIAVGRAMADLSVKQVSAFAVVRADGVVIAQSVGADVRALKAEAA